MKRLASVTLRKIESAGMPAASYLLRNQVMSKRVSADGFASLSDAQFSIDAKRSPDLVISGASVLHVQSDQLEQYLEDFKGRSSPKVLILGNCVRGWETFDQKLPSSVKRVYLQNSMMPNDLMFQGIPLGLQNLRLGRNGMPHLFGKQYESREKSRKVMLGPFGETHPLRKTINNTDFSSHEDISLFTTRMPSIETAVRSAGFKFIGAPRGNGKDTHRFWESLHRGSLPVVEDDIWADNMEMLGIPFVRTSGWSGDELTACISSKVAPVSPRDIGPLWMDYWKKMIQDSF